MRLKGTGSRIRGKGGGDVVGEERDEGKGREVKTDVVVGSEEGSVPVCVLEGGLGWLLLASCSAILSTCASKSS